MAPPRVGKSKFHVDMHAIKGMILFPSLGTPAIVEANGRLTVYLALQKVGYDVHTGYGGSPEPGSPIPMWLARQFFLQTVITPWSDRGRDYVGYKSYSDELAREATIFKRFYKGHSEVTEKYEEKKFGGFYIGKFEKDKEFLAEYYPLGDADQPPKGPFGVIHKAAVNMCLDGVLTGTLPVPKGGPAAGGKSDPKGGEEEEPAPDPDADEVGYRYVFQFTVSESFNLDMEGLRELLFLYIDYDNYQTARKNWKEGGHWIFKTEEDLHLHYLTHPGDELVSRSLIGELNSKAETLGCQAILKPTVYRRHPHMTPDTMEFVKLYASGKTKVLTQGQKNNEGKPDSSRGGGEKELHYLSDKNSWVVLSRHPVYVTAKEYLDIGVVSDLHLSSRQTSYKVVAPQVIHGAPPEESQYIGQLCHQTLETSQRMIKAIGAESDALIVAGDVFDVLRNLDPRILKSTAPGPRTPTGSEGPPEDAPVEIKMSTADLWEYLDFTKYDKKGPNYPFYIDALMFMGLILDYYYALRKPVFYITGNHEGWEAPYGISPRILNNDIIAIRANPGVPSDQNLTFYEAALLFGKKYSYLGYLANFDKNNMSWAYRWITPWKDCLVNTGKNQNILLLGWDDDENFILPFLAGGGGLPRAGSAFTDNQLGLLQRMASQGDKYNVLASHFTYANFEIGTPLHKQDQERSGPGLFSMEKSDTGTFEKNRTDVYSYLTGGKVRLTVSGHSHRAGAYTCFGDGQIDGLYLPGPDAGDQGVGLTESRRALKSVDPGKQFGGRVTCLVSGAGGLYCYQNLNNSKHSDIDKPQGMLIKNDSFGNMTKIRYVRDETSEKPRLAVRCDYLWYEDRVEMFFNGSDVRGDIVVERGRGKDRRYNIFLNPKWLFFLNDEKRKDGGVLPIKHFTLHFVSRVNYRYHDKAIKLDIEGEPTYPLRHHGDVPAYRLSAGPKKVNDELEKIYFDGFINGKSDLLFFLSVHFNTGHPIAAHYDLDSPWCYPVTIGSDSWNINRKFGRGGELPNYRLLGKIPEYQPRKRW